MKLEHAAIILPVMYDFRQSSAKFVLFRSTDFTTSVYLWTDHTYYITKYFESFKGSRLVRPNLEKPIPGSFFLSKPFRYDQTASIIKLSS